MGRWKPGIVKTSCGDTYEVASVVWRATCRACDRFDGGRIARQNPHGWLQQAAVPAGHRAAAGAGGFDRGWERTPRVRNYSTSPGMSRNSMMAIKLMNHDRDMVDWIHRIITVGTSTLLTFLMRPAIQPS